MGSLEFFVDTHPPIFKTTREQLEESPTKPYLPRAIRHALEKEKRIDSDQSYLTEEQAKTHLRAHRTVSEVEALVSGSRKEMQSLFKQIKAAKGILTKLERSYLYHYFRALHGDRMLAKVEKVAPGTSSKPKPKRADPVKERLAKMPEAERAEAETTLKRLGLI